MQMLITGDLVGLGGGMVKQITVRVTAAQL
jgi:hypothetical protein